VPALDLLGVRKALKRLAPGERRMVVLAYYEGLTQAQIADALGVPIGTVKSGTARALARLASALRDSRVAAEPACSGA
jgi:RNA polymerase sigma-70 factor (ECF subfamily)